jgi:hypothetical protein
MTEVCRWHEDNEGNWQTDCDNLFTFIEGGPSDNGMKFCCYCGKPLEEIWLEATRQSDTRNSIR